MTDDNTELYRALHTAVVGSIPRTRKDDLQRGRNSVDSNIPKKMKDDLERGSAVELGKKIFARWNRTLNEFACKPNSEDANLQNQLIGALTGKEGGTAVIAGLMITSFGASPAVAAVVAALLVKLVLAPAAKEVCNAWSDALSAS
jgi:hypothetical protein